MANRDRRHRESPIPRVSSSVSVSSSPKTTEVVPVANTTPSFDGPTPPHRVAAALGQVPRAERSKVAKAMGMRSHAKGSPETFRVTLTVPPEAVIATITTGVINQTNDITFASVADYTEWDAVFAEFRFMGAEVIYSPAGASISTAVQPPGYFVGGLDYSSNVGTPNTPSAATQLDQSKMVGLGVAQPTRWHANFTKLFPELWLETTGDQNVVVGSWKAYGVAAAPGATSNIGYVMIKIDLEFRGLL